VTGLVLLGAGIIAVNLAVLWPCRPWRKRARLPGGPYDGHGCLTEGERAEFDAITSRIKRRTP
jgi:hypothetical protein